MFPSGILDDLRAHSFGVARAGATTQALTYAAAEKARAISMRHLMLALLDRQEPDPAAALLAALTVDKPTLRAHLAAAA